MSIQSEIEKAVKIYGKEFEIWYNNQKYGKFCFTTTIQNGQIVHCEVKKTKSIKSDKEV